MFLAIDLGAESGRGIVGALDGDRLTLHEVHRFANETVRLPSGLHWDTPRLWLEIQEALRRAAAFARERGAPLESIGVDAWGVDYALLGASGALLAFPHAYRDERCHAAFDDVMQRVGAAEVYEATGIQLMAINTLYQLVAHHRAEPDLLERVDRMVFIPDLLHFFLSGVRTVEATIASTSQMTDARSGAWATGLLERLELPTAMLGPITQPGTDIGAIRGEVADATDAPQDLRVVLPAAHDTGSAVVAVPADPETSWCYLSSGTWSLIGAELDAPCMTDAAREASFTNEGGVDGTIRFLTNIVGLWLVQECRRGLAARGETYDYAELAALADEATPFRTLLDVRLPALHVPGAALETIEDFARTTEQPVPDTPGALVRCCLESLAIAYREALGTMEGLLGRQFDVLHVVGGGGRNTLLNRMTASATGRRVVVGPYEATAIGNVLVQAMGRGRVRDLAHARQIVRASSTLEAFEPEDEAAWTDAVMRSRALQAATA